LKRVVLGFESVITAPNDVLSEKFILNYFDHFYNNVKSEKYIAKSSRLI